MKLRHFAVFGGIFTVIICLLLFLFIVTSDDEESGSSSLDFSGLNLSAEVLKHQSTVEKYAKEYRISNYLLAIMQVESGGTGTTDVMQASESLGLPLNSLSVEDSIKQGCKYFSELLKSAEAKDCDINTVVQSYNYGGGFIDYVSKHGKKYTFELAVSFAKGKSGGVKVTYKNDISIKENGGWRYKYGNMFYVKLVSQYLAVPTLTCILLAFFDWRLALCMYITLPVAFLIIWLSKNYQKKLFERQVQAKLDASSQVQEYLEGMKIIKSCNLSGSHFSALNKALLSMKKIAVKVEMICGVFMSSASMILQAGIGIVIFVGTMLLVKGEIELLPLLMFFLMVTRIYGPILAILSQLTTLLNLNVVTERMRTLLSTSVMQGNDKEIENCDIELEHVTFRYNTKDVIKDVTCKIPQGSITALVGSSGSGKSTISKLIARFWDIQKGTIRVGGKDIRTMEPESLMRKMAFVFQDVTLFNDTVFNNISIGNPNATEEEVMAAAKAAYCDEFVRNMPDGYQTVLGENGSTLSGGERQRISIARALLKNASIIFLDEATASLDPENEVLVQKAIAQLVENKTVIMIAHRLRTVVDADQILVLDDGKLVEYGTHNELMKKKGVYQKLYHIQQESLGWTI